MTNYVYGSLIVVSNSCGDANESQVGLDGETETTIRLIELAINAPLRDPLTFT